MWTSRSPENTIGQDDLPLIEVTRPPQPVLAELLKLAQLSRVREWRSHLEVLKPSDSCYAAFADSLMQLARPFQTEEIEELLHQHLTGD
ncbi:MAG: hypothetical protein F6K30_24865 [Cyanothece sp. SIO2G6]|nr:hypothetical protein [Cyanothece sp. SIO2G6]